MLYLTIPKQELYNEETNTFEYIDEQHITLEHSLLAISKWESITLKPYMSTQNKTTEELLLYFKCMVIDQPLSQFTIFNDPNIQKQIITYIESPATATIIHDKKKSHGKEKITSDIIYTWMIELSIPFECQIWHLNRLMTLIRLVNNTKSANGKKKKINKNTLEERNRMNAERKKKYNTKG